MPVLSIVACRMQEDELVYLLSADREVRELLLVDGMQSLNISAKLRAQSRPHLLLGLDKIAPHLRERLSRSGGIFSRSSTGPKTKELVVVVSPLPLGLHSDLEQLKAAVYDNIRSLAAFSDGILIFYGKCGNALADLEQDLADLACPLYFLTDERGERIDDCIALALGGNEDYDRTLAEHQDVALFMTPMWASNWKAMGDEAASGKRPDLGAMLKGTGMTKVARIDTGLLFEPGFVEKVDSFAQKFGLQRIELPGGTAVAKGCYERAKSCLAAARPVIARPGARVDNFNSKGWLEPMRAICRITRKKFQGE
ncbi:MAG: DUF1638 domain-containing protein [Methanothrix sp.]|nr:DUF1638 domain-containing protein [Methanothrix sp.]MDD4446830.1 DUF1638 domain-containing protein [Methanothrix sp.]